MKHLNMFLTDCEWNEAKSKQFQYKIEKLGFKDNRFLYEYLIKLIHKSKSFRSFRRIILNDENISKLNDSELVERITYGNNGITYADFQGIKHTTDPIKTVNLGKGLENFHLNRTYIFDGNSLIQYYYDINHYLSDEISIKNSSKIIIKKAKFHNLISASNLASYTFCPVSFVISESFETEILESASKGTQYHEEGLLLRHFEMYKMYKNERVIMGHYSYIDDKYYNDDREFMFNDIKASIPIYIGHSEEGKKQYFKSARFIGQPDYIFKNGKGEHFVVEEKFRPYNYGYGVTNRAFDSHKIQVLSYISEIEEWEISYGYLLTWYHNLSGEIVTYTLQKIERTPQLNKTLEKTFENVSIVKEKRDFTFPTGRLNPNKCASCAVSRFCGHKTGQYDKISFPYSQNYLQLKYVKSPYQNDKKKATSFKSNAALYNYNKSFSKKAKKGFVSPIDEKQMLNELSSKGLF